MLNGKHTLGHTVAQTRPVKGLHSVRSCKAQLHAPLMSKSPTLGTRDVTVRARKTKAASYANEDMENDNSQEMLVSLLFLPRGALRRISDAPTSRFGCECKCGLGVSQKSPLASLD